VTDAEHRAALNLATVRAARLEDVELRARDGVLLRGWLFTPAAGSTRSAIVLHGQGNSRAGMLPYVDILLAAGLQVLAPDARAQGDSGGEIVSYGVVEANDVRDWVRRLRSLNGGAPVFGFGESMGAGTLLQALDGTSAFAGVVVESPFASFREVAFDRIGWVSHTGPWLGRTLLRPVVEIGFLELRLRYGVALDRASPMAAIRTSTVPVQLIHGTSDRSIPIRHSRLIQAARPQDTTLWEVPGAEHCGAIGVAPAEFARRLRAAVAAR
jgi:uncharacterized protein